MPGTNFTPLRLTQETSGAAPISSPAQVARGNAAASSPHLVTQHPAAMQATNAPSFDGEATAGSPATGEAPADGRSVAGAGAPGAEPALHISQLQAEAAPQAPGSDLEQAVASWEPAAETMFGHAQEPQVMATSRKCESRIWRYVR